MTGFVWSLGSKRIYFHVLTSDSLSICYLVLLFLYSDFLTGIEFTAIFQAKDKLCVEEIFSFLFGDSLLYVQEVVTHFYNKFLYKMGHYFLDIKYINMKYIYFLDIF